MAGPANLRQFRAHHKPRKSQKGMGGLLRGVEEVVGGVGDADFLVCVGGVAAGGWRFTAAGVEALSRGGAREHASAIVADDVDEKPGNGICVGRWRVGDG